MKLKQRVLFGSYSFLENSLYGILNILPHFLRKLIIKCLLKSMGKDVYIDHEVYIRYPKKMSIGNNVTINRGCKFFCSHYNKEAKIMIGNNVGIAPYVTFLSAGHDHEYLNVPNTGDSIVIKDYVWIGSRSIILQGVTIGEGAVIGAGSIVTKDIPDWSIAVGNPAKVVKKRKIKN